MISIDNALELAVKTYISRNLRVLNIKRKDYNNNNKQDFSKFLSLFLKVVNPRNLFLLFLHKLSRFRRIHML